MTAPSHMHVTRALCHNRKTSPVKVTFKCYCSKAATFDFRQLRNGNDYRCSSFIPSYKITGRVTFHNQNTIVYCCGNFFQQLTTFSHTNITISSFNNFEIDIIENLYAFKSAWVTDLSYFAPVGSKTIEAAVFFYEIKGKKIVKYINQFNITNKIYNPSRIQNYRQRQNVFLARNVQPVRI